MGLRVRVVGLLVMACNLLMGCTQERSSQDQRHIENVTWPSSPHAMSGSPPPELLNLGVTDGQVLKVGTEQVVNVDVKIGNAKVEGAHLKAIRGLDGRFRFGQKVSPIADSPRLQKKSVELSAKADQILDQIKSQETWVARGRVLNGPTLTLREDAKGAARFVWIVEAINEAETSAQAIEADESGRVSATRPLGCGFVEGQALVFPRGPKLSALSIERLTSLIGDGTLTNENVKATTALEQDAWSAQNIFQFPTEDHRFDQVQAFYSADRAVRFFSDVLGTRLVQLLDLKVHVGGVNPPSNSAYYYRGLIRIGAGDGVTYKEIARDASIVSHEVAHAFIDSISSLPSEGQGGSINEGFADFLAAHLLNHPNLGEASYMGGPYRRTVLNSTTTADFRGKLYGDSAVISGTLWEIRSKVGGALALKFTSQLLARMSKTTTFSDFRALSEYALMQRQSTDDWSLTATSQIREILDRRGFKEGAKF